MRGVSETDLLFLFLAEAPKCLPTVRVFRRTILTRQEMKAGYFVSAGVPGQCDAYAYVRGGAIIELETKAYKGRMREAQARWRAFCQEWGVPHLVLRAGKGEPAETTVARWVSELKACVESIG